MAQTPTNQVATRAEHAVSAPGGKIADILLSDKMKKQFALALPKHISADTLLRITVTQMRKNPQLAECTPESFFASLLDCAAMGLVPDNRQAYLVPFRNKGTLECQLIPGYQGFIDLAYRHPLVRGIRFNVVYEKDDFDYSDGLHPKIEHRRYEGEGDPGKLCYAYAICDIGDKGNTFVVLTRKDVMLAKAFSRGADSDYSPWRKNEAAMWAKTAVRALAKRMPRSAELAHAIEYDDQKENDRALNVDSIVESGAVGAGLAGHSVTPLEDKKPAAAEEAGGAGGGGGNAQETPSGGGPTLKEMHKKVTDLLNTLNIGKKRLLTVLEGDKTISADSTFADIPLAVLISIEEGWEEFAKKLAPSE